MKYHQAYLSRSNYSQHCSTFSFVPRLCLEHIFRIRLCTFFLFHLVLLVLFTMMKNTLKNDISCREIILHYWNERRAYQRNTLGGVMRTKSNEVGGVWDGFHVFEAKDKVFSWEKPEWTSYFKDLSGLPVRVNIVCGSGVVDQTGWVPQCRLQQRVA